MDPIGLLLIVGAIGGLLIYLLVDEFLRHERARYGVKLALIWVIVLLTVFGPSLKLVLLRQGSGEHPVLQLPAKGAATSA